MEWTNEQYHADTSRISKSGLDKINKSPYHYWESYLSPNKIEREETEGMATGTASHALILEPELFEKNYFLFDDSEKVAELERLGAKSPRAKKEYKEWRKGIELDNEGKKPLPPKDYDYYRALQDAIYKHSAASSLMGNGIAEQTVIWEDFETKAPCKCRPDWLNYSDRLIVDLKFVVDANPEGFGKAALNHRYDVQAPFYLDGVLASDLDFVPQGFVFIAVEKQNPSPEKVGVYFADADIMTLGRRKYTNNLETYMECRRTGIWHGYGQGFQPMKLPAWAFKKY